MSKHMEKKVLFLRIRIWQMIVIGITISAMLGIAMAWWLKAAGVTGAGG